MNSRVKKNSLLLIFYSFSGIAAQKKKKRKKTPTFLHAKLSSAQLLPPLLIFPSFDFTTRELNK